MDEKKGQGGRNRRFRDTENREKGFRDKEDKARPFTDSEESGEHREKHSDLITGRNAVTEALKSGRPIESLLVARSTDSRADFEIVSVEPATLSVYFDVPVTDREFIIEPFIQSDGAIIEPGYEAGSAIIDSASSKVKASGPVSEVNKITKIIYEVVEAKNKLSPPLVKDSTIDFNKASLVAVCIDINVAVV